MNLLSLIQTLLSVLESHQIMRFALADSYIHHYRRSGITPCPESDQNFTEILLINIYSIDLSIILCQIYLSMPIYMNFNSQSTRYPCIIRIIRRYYSSVATIFMPKLMLLFLNNEAICTYFPVP